MSEANMGHASQPAYGVSDHYLGEKGETYFAWQSGGGDFGGRINSHKFSHLVEPGHTVLDFGCGGGYLLRNLHCARRIGVEINPAAREAAIKGGIECFATVGEVPDGVADVIVSDHALEHVPFPIGALSELRTKLRPGGLLTLCVPHGNYWEERHYEPEEPNHHLQSWTSRTLGHTLSEAGYEVVNIGNRTHAWPGRWTVACYGRLPLWLFDAICTSYGLLTGKGQQVVAVARVARQQDFPRT
jgi:SAM-dependent methyltransferase